MNEITVLIADDHPIFRRGLQEIIESESDLRIVAAVADGDAALSELRGQRPQVAVLDVDMPKRDGFDVLKHVIAENLPTAIVMLTMHRDEKFFHAALDAGVKGYILKDSAVEEVNHAIRAAAKGENFISPLLSTLLVKRIQGGAASELDKLTASEKRVLSLVADAKSNKQIADELFISVRTVENHRSNICAKLGLTGKNALLAFAINHKNKIRA